MKYFLCTLTLSLLFTARTASAQTLGDLVSQAAPSQFSRSLYVGLSGPDVSALQQKLRDLGFYAYPEITGWYGPVTAQAVSRFQQAYADEILIPNNLSAPTGTFGPATRAKLASLSNSPAPASNLPASGGGTAASDPGCPPGFNYSFLTGKPCARIAVSAPAAPVAKSTSSQPSRASRSGGGSSRSHRSSVAVEQPEIPAPDELPPGKTQTTSCGTPVRIGKPEADNTGPCDISKLVATSSITVKQDGAIIENVDITGSLTVNAKNVIIRNFRINASGRIYGLKVFDGYSAVVEDGEITGSNGALLVGANFTARRLNLHHGGSDAINPYHDTVVEDSWIHHLGMNEGAHADGAQMGAGSNFVYRNNNFDMPVDLVVGGQAFRSNAAFFFSSGTGKPDNVLVDSNWLNGGNYTIYIGGTGHRIVNNRFGKDYRYNLITGTAEYAADNNVWDDTNTPVHPPLGSGPPLSTP